MVQDSTEPNISLQLVTAAEAVPAAEEPNVFEPAAVSSVPDSTQLLAATWALRLVLDTEHGVPLLERRQRADDLLAAIGPWVEWPEEVRQRFQAHLRHAARDDDSIRGDERFEPIPSSYWQACDWREFAQPFCSYAFECAGPLRRLLRTTLARLERTSSDPDRPG